MIEEIVTYIVDIVKQEPRLVTAVLASILVLVLAYPYVLKPQADIPPEFLVHQGSISSMRSEHQTAVYRSAQTPHGRSLVTGLSIARNNVSTHDGTLRHVYQVSLQARIRGNASPANMVAVLGRRLDEWTKSGAGSVLIATPNSLEAHLTVFAALLRGIPVQVVSAASNLPAALEVFRPAVLITRLSLIVQGVEVPKSTRVVTEDEWIGLEVEAVQASEVATDDGLDLASSKPTAGIDFVRSDNNQLVATHFSDAQLVAAIAGLLRALPKGHVWTAKDVVMPPFILTVHSLVANLATLVAGATLVFPLKDEFASQVQVLGPTIAFTDDNGCRSFSTPDNLKRFLGVPASYFLSCGTVPPKRLGVIPIETRLLYCLHDVDGGSPLSDREIYELEWRTASYVVHGLVSQSCASIVAHTSPYDHRLQSGDCINFGPVFPCLEAMAIDSATRQAADREGRLMIRGPAKSQEWSDLGVEVSLGLDGCVRLFVS